MRKKKPDLVFPVIHAFFGDSASANLDSEIAVFVEQCYQKREMLKDRYQPKPSAAATNQKPQIKSVPRPKRQEKPVSQTNPARR